MFFVNNNSMKSNHPACFLKRFLPRKYVSLMGSGLPCNIMCELNTSAKTSSKKHFGFA